MTAEAAGWIVAAVAVIAGVSFLIHELRQPSPYVVQPITPDTDDLQPITRPDLERPLGGVELADIWADLGIDERLLIFLGQRHRACADPSCFCCRELRENIRHYVVEGHPLPTEEEMA